MPSEDSAEDRLQVLMKTWEHLDEKIRSYDLLMERVIFIAVFLIMAVAGYAPTDEVRSSTLFLLLPFGAFGLTFYGLHTCHQVMSTAGYMRYVEERINKAVGERMLFWEGFLSSREHRRLPVIALGFLWGLVLAMIVGKSAYTAWLGYPVGVFCAAVAVNLAFFVGFIVAVCLCYRAFGSTYEAVKRVASQSDEGGT